MDISKIIETYKSLNEDINSEVQAILNKGKTPEQKPVQTSGKESIDPPTEVAKNSTEVKNAGLVAALQPQLAIARSVVDSIQMIFENDCGKSTMYKTVADQISNLEKTMRGTCEQVVSTVRQKNFDATNPQLCSPKAFAVIDNSDSRDRSFVDLAASIIVFVNSIR